MQPFFESAEPRAHTERIDEWPTERIQAEREEIERARATVVPVTDIMDTNAGDEYHLAENWVVCPQCGRGSPIDHDACAWGCE